MNTQNFKFKLSLMLSGIVLNCVNVFADVADTTNVVMGNEQAGARSLSMWIMDHILEVSIFGALLICLVIIIIPISITKNNIKNKVKIKSKDKVDNSGNIIIGNTTKP